MTPWLDRVVIFRRDETISLSCQGIRSASELVLANVVVREVVRASVMGQANPCQRQILSPRMYCRQGGGSGLTADEAGFYLDDSELSMGSSSDNQPSSAPTRHHPSSAQTRGPRPLFPLAIIVWQSGISFLKNVIFHTANLVPVPQRVPKHRVFGWTRLAPFPFSLRGGSPLYRHL